MKRFIVTCTDYYRLMRSIKVDGVVIEDTTSWLCGSGPNCYYYYQAIVQSDHPIVDTGDNVAITTLFGRGREDRSVSCTELSPIGFARYLKGGCGDEVLIVRKPENRHVKGLPIFFSEELGAYALNCEVAGR